MLDSFCIFHKGGALLFQYTLAALRGNPVEALIRTVLLEERAGEQRWDYAAAGGVQYTLKWRFHNELGLVFVAVYQRILQLAYVDSLLEKVRKDFVQTSVYDPAKLEYPEFEDNFRRLLAEAEQAVESARKRTEARSYAEAKAAKGGKGVKHADTAASESAAAGDDADAKPAASNGSAANGASEGEEAASAGFDMSKLKGKGKGKCRPGTVMPPEKPKKKPAAEKEPKKKQARVWDGQEPKKPAQLDFSDPHSAEGAGAGDAAPVDLTEKSRVDVDDYVESEEEEEEEEEAEEDAAEPAAARKGWFASAMRSSFVSSIVGKAALSREDVEPILASLKTNLMKKNVAEDIAEKLCESVATSLVGRKHASFTSLSGVVKKAMEEALIRILSPKRSTDILREVQAKRERGQPFSIVFVGVNGVGKSTNLSKVAYWLLQHDMKVMIAACDTFRAGAVEQLRTHCARLQVPLFERGYEKDPAIVAQEAIRQATKDRMDCVLVDTAGRMQDNEPLMRALAKLINVNQPDLVLFVGEALVGNDAVDQLSKFNEKLADMSTAATPRLIDGIVLTKFDTIDDKVGAALSMSYTSGAPIMFVGCGQTYTDLRKLNVRQVVSVLLK